jgi:hypothetical protein
MTRSLDPRSQEKHSLKAKIEQNIWDHLDDFLKVYETMKKGEWSWTKNIDCKYIDLRIDMRDGGCIISAKGERITPEQLAWQYSKEKPKPPEG